MVRFTVDGVLALLFGHRILAWAKNPVVETLLLALTVICIEAEGSSPPASLGDGVKRTRCGSF
jgi:hypothetical protein